MIIIIITYLVDQGTAIFDLESLKGVSFIIIIIIMAAYGQLHSVFNSVPILNYEVVVITAYFKIDKKA